MASAGKNILETICEYFINCSPFSVYSVLTLIAAL